MDTATFVKKSRGVHGDKYDYSLAEYNQDRSLRTTIICPVHNAFEQRPKNHLAGRGCPTCAAEDSARHKKEKASESILDRFRDVHGDRYDYSKVDYDGMDKKVTVHCHLHGDFSVTPGNHVWGKGCKSCYEQDKILKIKDFLTRAQEIHGGKYDYSLVKIEGPHKKVKIICPEHDTFLQRYSSHLQGDGCPSCAQTGYKSTCPGKLYVLELGDITKIGITNREVSVRVNQIKVNSGKKFNVLTEFQFEDGSVPQRMETLLLRELRKKYEQPSEKYDGSTESFLSVDIQSLLLRIRELSKELTE